MADTIPIACVPADQDLTGQTFGKWQVLSFAGSSSFRMRCWLCRCECGLEKVVPANHLRTGNSKACRSCGRMVALTDAFWSNVRKGDACWDWCGTIHHKGYGMIKHRRKTLLAHRVSYELACGPIADGLFVCHHCDNPLCVRPDHLFLGTNDDNMADMVRKGRQAQGEKHGRHKLCASAVVDIRARLADRLASIAQLAREYGVTTTAIRYAATGQTWKHVG